MGITTMPWGTGGARSALLSETVRWARALTIVAGAAASFGALATQAAAEVSFEGKTVKIIPNFSAGGSTDLYARTLAPFVAKHLPGSPDIIVEAKPGAGGVLAAAYMFNSSPPDGLELCLCNSAPTRWGTVQDFKFDVRDYAIVGSQANNTVIMIRKDLGVETFGDLAAVSEQLRIGTVSPADINSNRLKLAFQALGADLKIIGGYRGAAKSTQAAMSGETTVATFTDQYYLSQKSTIEENGELQFLGQVGIPDGTGNFLPDDRFPVPTWDTIWKEQAPDKVGTPEYAAFTAFNQAAAVQFFFVLAPNTPDDIRQAWETAFMKAMADPEYIAFQENRGDRAKSFTGEKATRAALEQIYAGFKSPEAVTVLRRVAPVFFK